MVVVVAVEAGRSRGGTDIVRQHMMKEAAGRTSNNMSHDGSEANTLGKIRERNKRKTAGDLSK